jgi:hypothetical protein
MIAEMFNVLKEICSLDTIVQRSRSGGLGRLEDALIILRRKRVVAKLVCKCIHKLCILIDFDFDFFDGFSIEHPAVFLGVLLFCHFFIPEDFVVLVHLINENWVFGEEEIAEIA